MKQVKWAELFRQTKVLLEAAGFVHTHSVLCDTARGIGNENYGMCFVHRSKPDVWLNIDTAEKILELYSE